ncbi:MAG: hypothetical protein RLY86_3274 [Pseudomonadota bacterium]|jgi:hypothetical protein
MTTTNVIMHPAANHIGQALRLIAVFEEGQGAAPDAGQVSELIEANVPPSVRGDVSTTLLALGLAVGGMSKDQDYLADACTMLGYHLQPIKEGPEKLFAKSRPSETALEAARPLIYRLAFEVFNPAHRDREDGSQRDSMALTALGYVVMELIASGYGPDWRHAHGIAASMMFLAAAHYISATDAPAEA